jgi:hypothetical protein
VAVGSGLAFLVHPAIGLWAEVVRAVVVVSLLAFEGRALIGWLGGVLERTDPAAVTTGG